jgi:flagellar biosynthesis protein FliQ
MNSLEVIEIIQEALWLLLKLSAPIMLVALIVGLMVALFQALTQIQEMTLTFVPKIIAIFFCVMMILPWMISTMTDYMDGITDKIITIEARDGGE